MKLLIVEDEERLANNLKLLLQKEKYIVITAKNGEESLALCESDTFDLILLDWMLPDIQGNILCQKIRGAGIKTPVIILTAKSLVEDKVEGLESGADDYLTKPFSIDELLARIMALVRRTSTQNASPIITCCDLEINTNTCLVKRGGKSISLSPKEYELLEYLMLNQNHVIDRLTLLEHIWGEDTDQFSNTVDVHIRYLRKKIDDNHKIKLIKTVKNKGYIICSN